MAKKNKLDPNDPNLTLRQRTALENLKKRKGFTPEGLERLQEAANRNKPWERSTGPVTPEGKRICSRNAVTHGQTYVFQRLRSERVSISRWLGGLDLDEARVQIEQACREAREVLQGPQ